MTAESPGARLAAELAKLLRRPARLRARYVLGSRVNWAGSDGPDNGRPRYWQEIGAEVSSASFSTALTRFAPIRITRSTVMNIGKIDSRRVARKLDQIHARGLAGTVTANTFTQLETKTWAACADGKAGSHSSPGHRHRGHRHKARPESWFVACQSSNEENSEGSRQHARPRPAIRVRRGKRDP